MKKQSIFSRGPLMGFFQLGNVTVGPFGILMSNESRLIVPTRFVKLYHCTDPSCGALHNVQLTSARTIMIDVLNKIEDLSRDKNFSEWEGFYLKKCKSPDSYYNENRLEDLPLSLINTFTEIEIKLVLKELIDSISGSRDLIPKGKRFKGSSENIVSILSIDECFQMILLFRSIDILNTAEKLIFKKEIYIPSTEIRRSKTQKSGGYFNIYHECNKLGFRTNSSQSHLSFIRLKNLILNIYDEPYLKGQIEWTLRFCQKESLAETVEGYINIQEPRKIIRELVLGGALQIQKTFNLLQGYFKMPTTPDEEEEIIDKVLWKLGFSVNIYPAFFSLYEDRLSKFSKIINESSTYSEKDKERIRSAAVNMFVSLEEILKHSLAFSTWLLLSDHYKVTHFNYNYTDATSFMTEIFNLYQKSGENKLIFDSDGKNTLYPLVTGFSVLFSICDEFLGSHEEENIRQTSELPGFIGKTSLVQFPLKHLKLLFDIKKSSYLAIRAIGIQLTENFNRHKVLAIRNSLEHDREVFPTKNEIIKACECMKDSIESLKASGLFPNVYLFKSLVKDQFNRVLKTFEDYNGKEIVISELINFKGYPIPSSYSPIVIVPSISFPETTDPVRIKYEENSEYLFYWKNYPKRKQKIQREESELKGI